MVSVGWQYLGFGDCCGAFSLMEWLDYFLLTIIGFGIGWAIADKIWNNKK